MTKAKRNFILFLVVFSLLFYRYHVQEFGFHSLISILALSSCFSFTMFMLLFFRMGNSHNIKNTRVGREV